MAIKTSDTALASIKSLEEAEDKGIIGWQRLEREARGYHRQRAALLTESVTHPDKAQKVTDLPQAFYRRESNLKEFQRGRPAELDDDVKANAMRHMVPKEILEAVDLQPQHRTFSEIRDYMLQQARQRADVFVGDVCHSTKNVANVTSRANINTPTTTKATDRVPMDVSQMSSNAFDEKIGEQESVSYQYEPDHEGDGDELFAVKGKGEGGFKGTCFKCGMGGHKADRCSMLAERKGRKEEREKGKGGSKGKWSYPGHTWENSWYHSNWHGKAYGLEVDPWAAVEPVPKLCAVSLKPEFSEPQHVRKGHCTHTLKLGKSGAFAHQNRFSILDSDDDGNSFGDFDVAKQVKKSRIKPGKIVESEMMNSVVVRNEMMHAWTRIPVQCSPGVVPCEIRGGQEGSSSCGRFWMEKSECDYGFRICRICRVCGP